MEPAPKPGFYKIFSCKCPRCRRGDMFLEKKPYKKGFMRMPDKCMVCGQYMDLEVGFYYGASYVSYALAVAISVATFLAWYVLIGVSTDDDRLFYWLGVNAVIILALQPILMRLARTMWLWIFVRYEPLWQYKPARKPERLNESQKNAW